MRLSFFVAGLPKPQGSKRAIVNRHTGKAAVIESAGQRLKDWRGDVRDAAATALAEQSQGITLAGPLHVDLTLILPRPKARKREVYPPTRPDVDKLARGVLDALTSARLYGDDGQVASLCARKLYASREHPTTGCRVVVEHLADHPHPDDQLPGEHPPAPAPPAVPDGQQTIPIGEDQP